MPQLVEGGHIYIAQPPLYKVKVGKDERYLKDEAEEAQFMLQMALKDAGLTPRKDAEPISGEGLDHLARQYALAEAVVGRLARHMDAEALWAIMNGIRLDLSSEEAASKSAQQLQEALTDPLAPQALTVRAEYDEVTEKRRLAIERVHHGNVKASHITEDFLIGADNEVLVNAARTFRDLIGEGGVVYKGDGEKRRESPVEDFGQVMKWLRSEAERGVSKQRYKGLGEMNPEQLWETTMDPTVRRLWKVQIEDAIAADEIFTTLMGDHVEPRRAFIESNALYASNIDI